MNGMMVFVGLDPGSHTMTGLQKIVMAALTVCVGFVGLVEGGKDTDEELAHYVKKQPITDRPWTSNEQRINKMIEDEIIKFNYAPETTECPFDSQGRPKPTESRQPLWWNAYRQAKDGDRPDWSAEIRELVKKGGGTYPPWTPSQESEPLLSKYKNIEPFTWRPGAPVINLRIKTDATTRTPTQPDEPTTERSIVLSSAHWDTSEPAEEGGKDPPLNLAPLQKGYKEENEYLKLKRRKSVKMLNTKQKVVDNSETHEKYLKNKVFPARLARKDVNRNIEEVEEHGKSRREPRLIKERRRQGNTIKKANIAHRHSLVV